VTSLRKRTFSWLNIALLTTFGLVGALAWGNRAGRARKPKSPPKTTAHRPQTTDRRPQTTDHAIRHTPQAARIKRQTVIGAIDIVFGPDGSEPHLVDVNPMTNRVYTTDRVSNQVSVIDGSTNMVTARIPVGGRPTGVAVNPNTNRIYVANQNSNNVSVIDGSTDQAIATVNVGNAPFGIAVNPNTNRIYVANSNSGSLAVIDGSNNSVTATINVGGNPIGVAVNPNTNRIYAANRSNVAVINGLDNTVVTTITTGTDPVTMAVNPNTNRIYVVNQFGNNVSVIEGAINQVIATIPVGDTPGGVGVALNTNKIYVSNQFSDDVTVIDAANNQVITTLPVGDIAVGAAVNQNTNRVYVNNLNSNTVNVIDSANDMVVALALIRSDPRDTAVNPATNKLYVTNQNANAVSVINAATNMVEATVPVGNLPHASVANPATNKIYVTNIGSSSVTVIDGATNTVTAMVAVGTAPTYAAVSPENNRIYVADRFSNTVSVIDGSTDTRIATINVGRDPYGVAVNPSGSRVYVSNRVDGTVSVIDGANNQVIATIPVNATPLGVAFNPATNRVYVVNQGSNNVSVIDATNNQVIMTVPVGAGAEDVDVNPAANRVYVANSAGNSLTVVDGANNTVVTTLAMNGAAFGVAVNPNTSRIYVGNNSNGTVNIVFDPPSSGTVTNTNDSGTGSLREAIDFANQNPGTLIEFKISAQDPGFDPVAGAFFIRPQNPLPPITMNGTMIDGTTQTGFTGNTNPDGPEIVINGGQAGTMTIGFNILNASNCLIRGLVINGFSLSGISINGTGATNNRVEGCYIGANERGDAAVANGKDGVVITDGAQNNAVGGAGGAAGMGNLISGNAENGVIIGGAGANGNRVQGNRIGVNRTGEAALPNGMNGVIIFGGASNNTIGGVGMTGGESNVISGNGQNGIVIGGAGVSGNQVADNLIGLNAQGNAAVGNGGHGIQITDGASNNVIGGMTAFEDGNTIAGNVGDGVLISGAGTNGNLVRIACIGGDEACRAKIPNGNNGITIADGAQNNVIGEAASDRGNAVFGNNGHGVLITDTGTTGNRVQRCLVGTNPSGDAGVGNALDGIRVQNGANGNVIGGAGTNEGCLVSGNGRNGIVIEGSSSNIIQGSGIGTDISGSADLGNAGRGVSIVGASMNVVGGTTASARNVVSGNGGTGVVLQGSGATDNRVQGNFIGTNITGAAALPNDFGGMDIIQNAANNTIGGTTQGAGNVISGNKLSGIGIQTGATGNRVQGNFLGADATGGADLGNEFDGLFIDNASNNLIGGITAGAGNVISGNNQNGVSIQNGASSNFVQGNRIGAAANGMTALGNSGFGVLVDNASSNTIGGSAPNADNQIAHNALDGVRVFGNATQNRIQGNNENNAGVTANDPGDADASPNKLQNFPTLDSVTSDGNNTTVRGELDSDTDNAKYPVTIEFFSNDTADPSGFGEGQRSIGSVALNAPGDFNVNNLPPLPIGQIVTATATDSDGNTSEFSQAQPVSAPVTVVSLAIGATPSVVDTNGQARVDVIATDGQGNVLPNVELNFQTTGGTLSAANRMTDNNGRASVTLSNLPFGTTTVTATTLSGTTAMVNVISAFRMVVPAGLSLLGLPTSIASADIGNVFRSAPVGIARWQPSALNSLGNYQFFSQQPFNLNRGEGYWINSDVAQTIEIRNGAFLDPTQPATLPLNRNTPGWVLGGNPTLRDLDWDPRQIIVQQNGVNVGTLARLLNGDNPEANPVEPYCWFYNADEATPNYELVINSEVLERLGIPPDLGREVASGRLRLGRGAFFLVRRPNLALVFPPSLQTPPRLSRASAPKRQPVTPSAGNWSIPLRAQADKIHATAAVVGVSNQIDDPVQVKKSPSVTGGQFVDLSVFSEKNEPLAWDVRTSAAAKMAWDVLISTNVAGDVNVTYPNLSGLPRSLRAYVVDLDTGKRQFMRTTSQFTFRANGSGLTQKRLRIEVTGGVDSRLQMNALQAAVAGGDLSRWVRLSFVLNREASLQTRVLSPTGKMVRAFPPQSAQKGLNVVHWDGKSQTGGMVARGPYVVELLARDEEGEQVKAVKLIVLR
jgi:YVTN family beta-propeller protein